MVLYEKVITLDDYNKGKKNIITEQTWNMHRNPPG